MALTILTSCRNNFFRYSAILNSFKAYPSVVQKFTILQKKTHQLWS